MSFPFRINRSAFGAGSWTGPCREFQIKDKDCVENGNQQERNEGGDTITKNEGAKA